MGGAGDKEGWRGGTAYCHCSFLPVRILARACPYVSWKCTARCSAGIRAFVANSMALVDPVGGRGGTKRHNGENEMELRTSPRFKGRLQFILTLSSTFFGSEPPLPFFFLHINHAPGVPVPMVSPNETS